MTDFSALFDLALEHLRSLDNPVARRIADRMEARSCGDCTACCTDKAVEDFEPPKPAWTPCEALCAGGCSRYETRPPTCRTYLCAYRLGFGGESARPDRAGVLVDLTDLTPGIDPAALPPDTPVIMGLVVRASGPYRLHPVLRLLNDARQVGIVHTAFAEPWHDRQPCTLRFDEDPAVLGAALSRHAGTGRAPEGWTQDLDGREISRPVEETPSAPGRRGR